VQLKVRISFKYKVFYYYHSFDSNTVQFQFYMYIIFHTSNIHIKILHLITEGDGNEDSNLNCH